MASKVRASEEVQTLINNLVAEADALSQKAANTDLTPDEVSKLGQLVKDLTALEQELQQARAGEEVQRIKSRMSEPTKPAPKVSAVRVVREEQPDSHALAFRDWIASHTQAADFSHDAYQRTKKYGYQLGSSSAKVDVDYARVNFKRRTILTKGGVGTGKEFIPQTYSDKVVEQLTYSSPIVGVVGSETTSDGNKRTYFKFDDTDLMSTYITDGGGSEANPTIPDVNVVTASVDMSTFDITSGFHKISFQELRDSAVDLESKIAKAVANAHARRIENDLINGTGNGTTGVQGLLAVDHSLGSISEGDLDEGALEAMYFAMPQPYRDNMVFLTSDAMSAVLRANLKDTTGRSLFDKNIVDGVEWPTILGKRYYTSVYMPDDVVLCFNPDLYMLRFVAGQEYSILKERFWPHTAIAGIMSWGGCWLGGTGASGQIHSYTVTS
jgi:HK97 family phage major capsid protein